MKRIIAAMIVIVSLFSFAYADYSKNELDDFFRQLAPSLNENQTYGFEPEQKIVWLKQQVETDYKTIVDKGQEHKDKLQYAMREMSKLFWEILNGWGYHDISCICYVSTSDNVVFGVSVNGMQLQ